MTSNDEETTKFKAWMRLVDKRMERDHGVGIDDIPDMPWWEWYKSDMKYTKAVKEAIRTVNESGWW